MIALRRAYKGLSAGVRGGIFLRIAAMFLVVLILPTGAILVAMNNAFHIHDFEETLRSQRYSMTQVVHRFNQFFDHIDQVVMDMVYSQAIQDSLVGKVILQYAPPARRLRKHPEPRRPVRHQKAPGSLGLAPALCSVFFLSAHPSARCRRRSPGEPAIFPGTTDRPGSGSTALPFEPPPAINAFRDDYTICLS